jgi:hypothetical protein
VSRQTRLVMGRSFNENVPFNTTSRQSMTSTKLPAYLAGNRGSPSGRSEVHRSSTFSADVENTCTPLTSSRCGAYLAKGQVCLFTLNDTSSSSDSTQSKASTMQPLFKYYFNTCHDFPRETVKNLSQECRSRD